MNNSNIQPELSEKISKGSLYSEEDEQNKICNNNTIVAYPVLYGEYEDDENTPIKKHARVATTSVQSSIPTSKDFATYLQHRRKQVQRGKNIVLPQQIRAYSRHQQTIPMYSMLPLPSNTMIQHYNTTNTNDSFNNIIIGNNSIALSNTQSNLSNIHNTISNRNSDHHNYNHQQNYTTTSTIDGLRLRQHQPIQNLSVLQAVLVQDITNFPLPCCQNIMVGNSNCTKEYGDLNPLEFSYDEDALLNHYNMVHGLTAVAISEILQNRTYEEVLHRLGELSELLKQEKEYRIQAEKFDNFYISTHYPWLRCLYQNILQEIFPQFPLSIISIIIEYTCAILRIGDHIDVLDRRGREFWYNAVIIDIKHCMKPPSDNLYYINMKKNCNFTNDDSLISPPSSHSDSITSINSDEQSINNNDTIPSHDSTLLCMMNSITHRLTDFAKNSFSFTAPVTTVTNNCSRNTNTTLHNHSSNTTSTVTTNINNKHHHNSKSINSILVKISRSPPEPTSTLSRLQKCYGPITLLDNIPKIGKEFIYETEGPLDDIPCTQILIHYLGWNKRWNEWIPAVSTRIIVQNGRTIGKRTGPDFLMNRIKPISAPNLPLFLRGSVHSTIDSTLRLPCRALNTISSTSISIDNDNLTINNNNNNNNNNNEIYNLQEQTSDKNTDDPLLWWYNNPIFSSKYKMNYNLNGQQQSSLKNTNSYQLQNQQQQTTRAYNRSTVFWISAASDSDEQDHDDIFSPSTTISSTMYDDISSNINNTTVSDELNTNNTVTSTHPLYQHILYNHYNSILERYLLHIQPIYPYNDTSYYKTIKTNTITTSTLSSCPCIHKYSSNIYGSSVTSNILSNAIQSSVPSINSIPNSLLNGSNEYDTSAFLGLYDTDPPPSLLFTLPKYRGSYTV